MTLPRFDAIAKHWERIPPLSVSVAGIAAALGVERKARPSAGQDMGELAGLVGSGFTSEIPEWLKTVKE